MNRRRALATLIVTPLLAARAQAQPKPKRVAYVPTEGFARVVRRNEGARDRKLSLIRQWFAENGLVPGRDVVVDYVDLQLADGDAKALEGRAKALLATQPDLIAVGEDGVEVLSRLTRSIPIVFDGFSGDPAAFGLVRSYNRPGGNITGSTLSAPGADAKALELMRELAPAAKRFGVLWREEDLKDPWSIADGERMKAIAAKLGFEWVPIPFAKTPTLAPIERAIRAARVDVLDTRAELEDPWVKDLMRFVERNKLPALWAHQERVREGGLAAVHGAYGEASRDAFAIAARILRGANPAEVPVAFPTRIVTAINLRTARAMGLDVPPSILVRASVVVQ